MRRGRSFALGVLAALELAGCYLAHERPISADATTIDAGPIVCERAAAVATVLLDEGVSPQIAALPSGDVGVVYVRVEARLTRVVYERLDAALARVTGPMTIGTDAASWAEIETVGSEIVIAYGLAGDRETALVHVSADGAPIGERVVVQLLHPSILDATSDGVLLWGAFDMRTDNTLVLSHVTSLGVPLHAPVSIPLGRYGSGHHALARDDGSHVLGYPSEGPPGARHGHLRTISGDGTLGADHLLDAMDADRAVTPVRLSRGVAIVRETDALVVERTDERTLDRIDRASFPPVDGAVIASALGGRLLVAHTGGGTLRWDLYTADLSGTRADQLPAPFSGIGGSTSVARLPGATVLAFGLVEGPHAAPWLVRLECAP